MAAPNTTVCTPWATSDDVCGPCNDYTFDPILLDDALAAASDVLFALSGRQFPGVCSDTVRPTGVRAFGDWSWWMGRFAGNWRLRMRDGYVPCGCGRLVGCSWVPAVPLAPGPVVAITEVKMDGVVVDPATYRVDDYGWLVRLPDPVTGINEGWPCCQNLTLPTTAVGTFSVTFQHGTAPPPGGVRAAAALGCQLALSCAPDGAGDCSLPERVTSITRQGVSMVVIDPFTFLDDGKTGIYEVDLFLKAVNPDALRRPPTVLTPDMARRVRTT